MRSTLFLHKKDSTNYLSSFIKKCRISSIDPVIKFFTQKGLNATKISNQLDSAYKDDAASYCTVAKWLAEFKESEHDFEDSPRTDCLYTITTDQNFQTIEWIVMDDRQLSVCRLVYELAIPTTTTVYEIMSNHLDTKKVSTRWVRKLLTRI